MRQVRAAVAASKGADWSVETLELDDRELGAGELLVRMVAAGLCHTDEHFRTGDFRAAYPFVGGHEGAGVVEAIGPGTAGFAVGDHVVLCFRPSCGHCQDCASGRAAFCEAPEAAALPARFRRDGEAVGGQSQLGTFSEYAVVPAVSAVPIPKDIDFGVAALLGCSIPTGYGAAVHSGDIHPGDAVIVVGMGGVGVNAVQGAKIAGAGTIVAVDTSTDKRDFALSMGAAELVGSVAEAHAYLAERGLVASTAILSVAVPSALTELALALPKGGTLVITAMGSPERFRFDMPVIPIVGNQIRIQGTVLGGCNLRDDIPRIINLYKAGRFQLDELISHRYSLEEIGEGYQQMHHGNVMRAVIDY